jgi:hypothetical protein
MGRRRRVSPEGRNARRGGFAPLALGVSALALLLGFLFGLFVYDREEAAPPAPPARTVTVEKTVEKKTVRAPEKTALKTTSSATASASP